MGELSPLTTINEEILEPDVVIEGRPGAPVKGIPGLKVRLPHLYSPRDYQVPFANATSEFKRIITVWHRRAGKDLSYISMLVPQTQKRVGTYVYCFPTATQGKRILWEGIDGDGVRFIDRIPAQLIAHVNNTEMKVTLTNGSMICVIGSDNYDRTLVGTNPIGIIYSEYSLQKPEVWDYCRPILRENKGWAWFNFTPRGKNHAYHLLMKAKKMKSWFTQVLGIDETGVLTEADVQEEIDSGMSWNRAQQEFYCSFDAEDEGLIYGRQMNEMLKQERIGFFEYDPQLPLYTCWDLGIDDDMVIIFFQLKGSRIVVVDHYANNNRGLKWYWDEILKPWRQDKGYRYEEHFAPHDVQQREQCVQDANGFAMTRKDAAAQWGLNLTKVERAKRVWDRIEICRGMFRRIYINSSCEALINAVSSYKKRVNKAQSTDSRIVYDPKPDHDWSSHSSDAFGEMCRIIKQGLCSRSSSLASLQQQVNLINNHPKLIGAADYDPLA